LLSFRIRTSAIRIPQFFCLHNSSFFVQPFPASHRKNLG
jgi:mRNA-degrading endonuclease RelE of RelBE toxin-antitoxin system